jgi:catalase
VAHLSPNRHTLDFVKDQYRHCKSILAIGASSALLDKAGIQPQLPNGNDDPGILRAASGDAVDADAFIAAIGKHRHFIRETDPPLV